MIDQEKQAKYTKFVKGPAGIHFAMRSAKLANDSYCVRCAAESGLLVLTENQAPLCNTCERSGKVPLSEIKSFKPCRSCKGTSISQAHDKEHKVPCHDCDGTGEHKEVEGKI